MTKKKYGCQMHMTHAYLLSSKPNGLLVSWLMKCQYLLYYQLPYPNSVYAHTKRGDFVPLSISSKDYEFLHIIAKLEPVFLSPLHYS